MKKTIRKYYQLTKPGIIYGNLLTTIAGFFFALGLQVRFHLHGFGVEQNFVLFISLCIATALVIGSACVFNNYLDRRLDLKMGRTKERVLAQGNMRGRDALVYAAILFLVGSLILFFKTTIWTTGLEIGGVFSYVVLYGVAKRFTSFGVVVGSIPGAIPVVAGYCAVTDKFDFPALILFIILVLWQMPHFYAIALYRRDEYRSAGILVLPLRKGVRRTKIEMFIYILFFFVVAAIVLRVFGYVGYLYSIIMLGVAAVWLYFSIQGFGNMSEDEILVWSRKMFLYSLIVITVFSIMLSMGPLLF